MSILHVVINNIAMQHARIKDTSRDFISLSVAILTINKFPSLAKFH